MVLAAGSLATTAMPVSAVSAGCSTISDTGALLGPGKLFVQASYGEDPTTLFRFYLKGPETVVVYEGHAPRSFFEVISGLTPGIYQWRLFTAGEGAGGPGSYIEVDVVLATCTVNGGPVITPPLEKPSAITVTPIVAGNAVISWSGGPGAYRVVAKRLNKRGRVQVGTKRTCTTTLTESGAGSCELLDLRPGRWRFRITRTYEGSTASRVKVLRVAAGQ